MIFIGRRMLCLSASLITESRTLRQNAYNIISPQDQSLAIRLPLALPAGYLCCSFRLSLIRRTMASIIPLSLFLLLFKTLALFLLSTLPNTISFVPSLVGDSPFLSPSPLILSVVLAVTLWSSYSSNSKRLRLTISLERFCPIPRTLSSSGLRQAQPFSINTTS